MANDIKIKHKYLVPAREFLGLSHPLATGPNHFKSKFGRILEGIFRKDYFTLQTIVSLTDLIVSDEGFAIVFGGSILDLSRRVLEDMIYMYYVKEKGTDKYSEQFINYAIVEQKRDLDFLRAAGVVVDESKYEIIDKDYSTVPNKLKQRDNWSAQSVEQILLWFVKNNKMSESEKETILRLYILGNRKNHTSSGDILGHSFPLTLEKGAGLDIDVGLMITYGSVLKVALLFLDEIKVDKKCADSIVEVWEKLKKLNSENDTTS